MLAASPEVLEVHRTVGEDCFFLKVRVRDTAGLGALLDEKIQRLPPVASTKTTIALSTAKERLVGPQPASERPPAEDEQEDRKAS